MYRARPRAVAALTLAAGTCLATIPAAADTLFVPTDYPTIQAAIDAAVDGDVVQVFVGTYNEDIDFDGKAITVIGSQFLSVRTIINGTGTDSVVKMVSGEGPDSVLEFVIVQGGDAVFGGGLFVGGGADPTIRNVLFRNNNAGLGGGAVVGFNADPAFEGCVFRENTSDTDGGGVYAFSGNPLFDDVTFILNTAVISGGGYAGAANATFLDCQIEENTASDAAETNYGGGISLSGGQSVMIGGQLLENTSGNLGGGLAAWNGGGVIMRDVFVRFNEALAGGGVHIEGGTATINRCRFDSNEATNFGGGLYVGRFGNADVGQSEFLRNEANVGSAMRTDSPATIDLNNALVHHNIGASAIDGFESFDPGAQTVITLRNCSVVENQNDGFGDVGGVVGFGAPQINIYNSILWNNQGGDFDNIDSRTDIDYTTFSEFASYAGIGNNAADPQFVEPTGPAAVFDIPNYRLMPGSAMIDSASNFLAPLDQTDDDFDFNAAEDAPFDFRGSTRRRDDTGVADTGAGSAPVIDRGAYEFQGTSAGCNAADVVPPFGTLDIDDVLNFLDDFASGNPGADIAPPTGTLNIDDVLAFLDAFAAGCR